MKPNRRGAFKLEDIGGTVMILILSAALFVGGYLAVDGLSDAADTDGNASTVESGVAAANNMTSAMDNVVTYAPTWGTIIGVSVLITIVVVGFGMARSRGFV